MNPDYYGLVELVVSGAIVLGLAFWQLWSVNRELAKDRAERRASAERPGHPVGEHGLDDR